MTRTLSGVLPILQTPFTNDDRLDWPALHRCIDWAYSQGVAGLGTGMVSEILKLRTDERLALTSALVEMSAGRGSVFVAVGAESAPQAVWLAEHAEQAGCDAVMAAPPLAGRLPAEAIREYYQRIADSIPLPVIVQDASGYVGNAIPLHVCTELLDQYGPDKILFKPEAAPIGPQLSALRDATASRARIFDGSGGILLVDCYRRGIVGTMPGMDLLDGIVALWQALQRGDDEAIYQLYFPIAAIVTLQLQAGLDGFLAIEKYLLVKRGLWSSPRRRRPYSWSLDPETTAEVDRLWSRYQRALEPYSAQRPV